MPRHEDSAPVTTTPSFDGILIKGPTSIGPSIGSAARHGAGDAWKRTPKPATFDPDADDADSDNVVQEGTTQERLKLNLPEQLERFSTILRPNEARDFTEALEFYRGNGQPLDRRPGRHPVGSREARKLADRAARRIDQLLAEQADVTPDDESRWRTHLVDRLAFAVVRTEQAHPSRDRTVATVPVDDDPSISALSDELRQRIANLTPEQRASLEQRRERGRGFHRNDYNTRREADYAIRRELEYLNDYLKTENPREERILDLAADVLALHDVRATIPEPNQDRVDYISSLSMFELREMLGSDATSTEDRQIAANVLADRMYEMKGVDKTGAEWQSEVTSVEANSGGWVEVAGVINDDKGQRIGKWTRSFDALSNVVTHDVFEVTKSKQKNGIGGSFVKFSMHQAREAGFTRVELHAVNDEGWNGFRTWPRLGFQLEGEPWTEAYTVEEGDKVRQFEELVGMPIENLTEQDIIDHVDDIGDINLHAMMSLYLDELPEGPPPHVESLHGKSASDGKLTWDDWTRILDEWRIPDLSVSSASAAPRRRVAHLGRTRTVKSASRLATKGKPPIPVTFPGDMNPHFVCPPGTPRGGQWTDRLGTDCMLPEPQKLGRTIGDLANGPDKPGRDLIPNIPSSTQRPRSPRPALVAKDESELLKFFTHPEGVDPKLPIRLPSGKAAPDDPVEAAAAFRAELQAILEGPMADKLPILERHAQGSLKLPDVELDPVWDPSWDTDVGKTPAKLIAESLAHDLYDIEGVSKTGTGWTSRVKKVVTNDNSSTITGDILDENGDVIGEFTRQLYFKNRVAYHTVFEMDKDQQENGIGGAFVKESMHQARDAGFKKIDLHAVVTPELDDPYDEYAGTHYTGLIVWPHLGFKLTSPVAFEDDWQREHVLDELGLSDESQIDEQHLMRYPEVFKEVYADANMSLDLEDLPANRPPHARALNRKGARPGITWDDWDHWLDQLTDPYVDPKKVERQRRARRRTRPVGRTMPEAKGLPRIGSALTSHPDLPGGKKKPKVVPFDPDPVDADHDRVGQEGTIHERLLTPDLDPLEDMAEILRGDSAGKLKALRSLAPGRQDPPQTEKQLLAARRIGASLARDLYGMKGIDANGRKWEARIESVEIQARGHQLSINGKIYAPVNWDDDPDFDPEDPAWWVPIGYFTRTIYPSLEVAQHDVIRLDKDQRGTGIGTSHVMESMHRAREAGLQRVELPAMSQPEKYGIPAWNGVSTWPMLGFEITNDSMFIPIDGERTEILQKLGLSDQSQITADHIREHQDLFKGVEASADMALDLANLPEGRPPNIERPNGKAANPKITWADWKRLLDEYFATMPPDYPDHVQPGRGRYTGRKVFAAFVATKVSRPPVPVTFPGDKNPHFVCPPGTPRGGEWTDRLGTNCMLPHPEQIGQTIGDLANGPNKPLSELRSSDTSVVRQAATEAARAAAEPPAARRRRSADALIDRIRTELPRAEADLADRRDRHAAAIAAGDDDATIADLARSIDEAAREVADYRRMLELDGPPPNEPPRNEPPVPDGKPPRFSRDTIKDLVTKVRENEGFTVNANNAEDQVSGYAVGIGTGEYSGVIDAEQFMTDDEFAIAEVEKWLAEQDELLSSDQVDHIGAWYDTEAGKVVLDPVQVVPDDGPYSPNPTEPWRSRAEDQALELCRARDQRSMFHLDTFRTVWCGGTGGYADDATERVEPIRLPMTLPDRIETTDQFFPADRFTPGTRADAIDDFETRLKQVWYRWDGARGIRQAAWDIMGTEPTGIDPQIGRRQTTPDAPWVQNPDGWRDELADGGADYFARYILSRMLDEDHGGHERGELYRGIRLTPEEAVAMFGDAEQGISGVVEEGKSFDMPPMAFAERMSVGVVDLTEFYGTDVLLVVKGNPRALRLMPMVNPMYDESDEEDYLDYFLDPDNLQNIWEQTGRADTFDSPEELQAAIDQTIAEIEAAYEEYKQALYKELDFEKGQKLGQKLGEMLVDAGEMRERVILAGMPRDDGYGTSWDEEQHLPHEVLAGGRFYVRSIYPDPRGRYGKIVEVEQIGVIDPATGNMVDTTDISKQLTKGFATWLIDLL